ncbi:MAG: competence protein ComEA [Candidatus Nomurabacteria bacterium]|nr:competence protein ComEA [Candidatus Nomurabacteria bacterium]
MKYTVWLFLGALLLPCVAFGDVKINEVAWMGTTKSQYSEWIELYNSGEEAISLTGWKLYKDGNSVLYTLSKSIAAHGYLLIERTTASAPDAVEGISDESGPFGASGLRNTGENVSLKDSKGNVVDTLSFSSGWPAGEAASGKTMQWDGTGWITAEGTPDAANVTVTDVVSETTSNPAPSDDTENTTAASAGNKTLNKSVTMKAPPVLKKPTLAATVPKNIFQGVSDEYSASFENADAIKNPLGYFYWNMGDGTTYIQQTLSLVPHAYHYAGTYTVSLSYYLSPSASKPILQSIVSAIVTKPLATVEAMDDDAALRITNNTSKTMDIGQWPITMTEGIRSMPGMTMIGAKASIVISAQTLGVSAVRDPVLHTPDGTKVLRQ